MLLIVDTANSSADQLVIIVPTGLLCIMLSILYHANPPWHIMQNESQESGENSAASRRYFSLPNLLSGSRVILAGFMYRSISESDWYLAVAILWLAICTDVLDGFLARRRGLTSPFGGLLDHGCDAVFVTAGLAALVAHGWVPLLLVILVPVAFTQYVLDSNALKGKPLRTSQLGKFNGISYFVLTGLPVMQITLGITLLPMNLLIWVAWGLVLTTLMSMTDRLVTLLRR